MELFISEKMRSDEWILVEDAFTEPLSVFHSRNSISDVPPVVVSIDNWDTTDLLLSDKSILEGEQLSACSERFEAIQEEPANMIAVSLLEDVGLVQNESETCSPVQVDLRGFIRKFTTLNIISPRIDPELGRLAAPKLRAGNLVGSIYRPDIESVRVTKRFRDRASILLRAN